MIELILLPQWMDKFMNYTMMVLSMKAKNKVAKDTATGSSSIKMEVSMKENGIKERFMGKGYYTMIQGILRIMVYGKMRSFMAEEKYIMIIHVCQRVLLMKILIILRMDGLNMKVIL